MSTRYPSPVRRNGKWLVDLRPWGFGEKVPLGPDTLSDVEAVHLAWARLEQERAARLAEPRAQTELVFSGGPRTFAGAMDEWERAKEYDTKAGARYSRGVARLVRQDFGAYELPELAAHQGSARLVTYRNAMRDAGSAARTIRNRFSVLAQVLRLAADRRWLAGMPAIPKLPRKPPPQYDWIDEHTFRAVRACVYSDFHAGRGDARGCVDLPEGEAIETWVARRRCFLSLVFYLGLHAADAATFRGEYIGLDTGTFTRVNTKSAAHVPVEMFDEVPEPLLDDLRALLSLLGREAFYQSELVGGGEWPHVSRLLARAQKRLAIPGPRLNTRILRRSWVRQMRLLGYSLEVTAARAGHSDTTMIHEVYSRVPQPVGRARESRWKRSAPRPHAGTRVVVGDFGKAKVARLVASRSQTTPPEGGPSV